MIAKASVDQYTVEQLKAFLDRYKHEGYNEYRTTARCKVIYALDAIDKFEKHTFYKTDDEYYAAARKIKCRLFKLNEWLSYYCNWKIIKNETGTSKVG